MLAVVAAVGVQEAGQAVSIDRAAAAAAAVVLGGAAREVSAAWVEAAAGLAGRVVAAAAAAAAAAVEAVSSGRAALWRRHLVALRESRRGWTSAISSAKVRPFNQCCRVCALGCTLAHSRLTSQYFAHCARYG